MSPSAAFEAKAEFLLGLRARGIGNIDVLRALETVPRELFVQHRHADLANRDMALPIACGQTMPEPFLVARMMEALELAPGLRVLEIGAGSGYATAILARLSGEVMALERFQSLAIAATARLEKLGVRHAQVVWGDGLAVTPAIGLFDRILVHGELVPIPEQLLAVLAGGGMLVAAGKAGADGQWLRRVVRGASGGLEAANICRSRLRPLIPGVSREL